MAHSERELSQIQPISFDEFRKRLAEKCKSIPSELEVNLHDIKSMNNQQKLEKKDEITQNYQTLKSVNSSK